MPDFCVGYERRFLFLVCRSSCGRKHRQKIESASPASRRKGARAGAGRGRMLSKFMGPRYGQLLRIWMPTMSMWGTVGAVGLVWATDWRLFLDYVPWINGKFKKDD
ncbi:cytochrome b-c1 complex subunit 10-like [Zootoca vivipara]|uniref:cytochrome b-c1 complex subunit 10-like n=1 Tax=Zootoca vivipara TaxID=8524 RepID=UPI001591101A|nr:cytochrome b-c1 complex subunit 10-like [Zootoca vivipara]